MSAHHHRANRGIEFTQRPHRLPAPHGASNGQVQDGCIKAPAPLFCLGVEFHGRGPVRRQFRLAAHLLADPSEIGPDHLFIIHHQDLPLPPSGLRSG